MEVISCDLLPQGIGDVSGQHGLGWQGSLVFGVYRVPPDIVDYICIDARPVNCLSGMELPFFYPLVCIMEVSEGMVKEVGGSDLISLQENTSLNGQLILGTPEVMGNFWDVLEVVGPSPEG